MRLFDASTGGGGPAGGGGAVGGGGCTACGGGGVAAFKMPFFAVGCRTAAVALLLCAMTISNGTAVSSFRVPKKAEMPVFISGGGGGSGLFQDRHHAMHMPVIMPTKSVPTHAPTIVLMSKQLKLQSSEGPGAAAVADDALLDMCKEVR